MRVMGRCGRKADANSAMTIRVTGGTGFIGSRVRVEPLDRRHDVVAVDDYSNSSPEALA